MNKQFIITNVVTTEPSCLVLTFGDGKEFTVDISTVISGYPFLSPLKNPKLFREARIDAAGMSVVWNDEIDLAGDNLRAEAVEQSGGISHERIWNWMHRNELSLSSAASALGISRRMLAYYRNGEKTIPKHIWLACLGWEHSTYDSEEIQKIAA